MHIGYARIGLIFAVFDYFWNKIFVLNFEIACFAWIHLVFYKVCTLNEPDFFFRFVFDTLDSRHVPFYLFFLSNLKEK